MYLKKSQNALARFIQPYSNNHLVNNVVIIHNYRLQDVLGISSQPSFNSGRFMSKSSPHGKYFSPGSK